MADGPLNEAERDGLSRLMGEISGTSDRIMRQLARDSGYAPRVALAELSMVSGCLDQARALLRREDTPATHNGST